MLLSELKSFRCRITTFITRYHTATEVMLVWINVSGYLIGIGTAAHGEDVQFVQLGYIIQEFPTVRSQSCVVSDTGMFT